jgi:hypothetical protein
MTEIPATEEKKVDTGAATTVSAASIVSGDTDKFPPPTGNPPPPIAGAGEPSSLPPQGEGKRGRGRPPGSKNRPRGDDPFTPPPPPEPPKPPVDYDALAIAVFGMTTGILAQSIGPEWLPREPPPGLPGEKEMVCTALATYMKSKNMPDLPPGVMLCLVIGMYSAPRLQAPATKEKVKGMWFWLRSKFGRKKKDHIPSENTREPEKKAEPAKGEDKKDDGLARGAAVAGEWSHPPMNMHT